MLISILLYSIEKIWNFRTVYHCIETIQSVIVWVNQLVFKKLKIPEISSIYYKLHLIPRILWPCKSRATLSPTKKKVEKAS